MFIMEVKFFIMELTFKDAVKCKLLRAKKTDLELRYFVSRYYLIFWREISLLLLQTWRFTVTSLQLLNKSR